MGWGAEISLIVGGRSGPCEWSHHRMKNTKLGIKSHLFIHAQQARQTHCSLYPTSVPCTNVPTPVSPKFKLFKHFAILSVDLLGLFVRPLLGSRGKECHGQHRSQPMGRMEPASMGSKEAGLPVIPRKFIGIIMIGTTLTNTSAATESVYSKRNYSKKKGGLPRLRRLHVVFLPTWTIDC
ncbi:hypothetical protein NE237_001519 [Protea cynaroides]|uniref:Uncharacterized protein n=1 Tax=Protea cynaroides TaxID=273540 RepID=A0A9Q0KT92_9MAGN|nr:hypothetical protein NE237_001519 [Protea cynaroides]